MELLPRDAGAEYRSLQLHTVGIPVKYGTYGDYIAVIETIVREVTGGPDLSLQIIPLDIEGILSGRRPDVTLKRNDIVDIPSTRDLEDQA